MKQVCVQIGSGSNLSRIRKSGLTLKAFIVISCCQIAKTKKCPCFSLSGTHVHHGIKGEESDIRPLISLRNKNQFCWESILCIRSQSVGQPVETNYTAFDDRISLNNGHLLPCLIPSLLYMYIMILTFFFIFVMLIPNRLK